MNCEIQVRPMQQEDIEPAVMIWGKQFCLYCDDSAFPRYWAENTGEIKHILENQTKQNNAFVAEKNGLIVGFIGFFVFEFHNEKSALCNVTSHAAEDKDKEQIYLSLYKHISRQWIKNDIFNHLWMFFYRDDRLKLFLYDLGFGSHAVDAFARTSGFALEQKSPYPVRLATGEDFPTLQSIVADSVSYYSMEPLFLKRETVSPEKLHELIARENIFVACDGDDIIGFINANRSTENEMENLSEAGCGLINELGAYIKQEYRGNKLGERLLNAVAAYCADNGIGIVHVDWESANPLANKFWRKHFTPMILSVRRTINKDANS